MSRYFERVERPEQLIPAALEAMRVLTDPAETGAVTLALPEDVQAEAFDGAGGVPGRARRGRSTASRPPPRRCARAAELVRAAQRPLIVAGGGVIYSEATEALRAFVDATGIPVAETQAGRGALVSDHPLSLGAVGATGTPAANRLAREADLVIGIGTRWSDFTTASKSAFQDPGVRFVNVNVTSFDAAKHGGLALVGRRARGARALATRSAGSACARGLGAVRREQSAAWDARGRRGWSSTPGPSTLAVSGRR